MEKSPAAWEAGVEAPGDGLGAGDGELPETDEPPPALAPAPAAEPELPTLAGGGVLLGAGLGGAALLGAPGVTWSFMLTTSKVRMSAQTLSNFNRIKRTKCCRHSRAGRWRARF
jgi:hypothetical protein